MAESTCLHIQDRESGPIRIVEIPWISVRIGRAAFCEVRLTDPGLADLACRLHRRGRTWYLTPIAIGPTTIDGQTVEAARALEFDAPFQVGPYSLALKRNKFAEPDWRPPRSAPGVKATTPPRAARRPEPPTLKRPDGFNPPPIPDRPTAEPASANAWEARWKAAGDRLKSSTTATRPAAPAPPRAEPYAPPRPAPTAAPSHAPAQPPPRFESPLAPRPVPTPTPTVVPTPTPEPPPRVAVQDLPAELEVVRPIEAKVEPEAAPSFFDSMSDPVAWMTETPAVVDDVIDHAVIDDEEDEVQEEVEAAVKEVEITFRGDAPSLYEIAPCDEEPSLYEATQIPNDPGPTEWAFAPVVEPAPDLGPVDDSPRSAVVATTSHDEPDKIRNWAKVEAERLDRQEREEQGEPQPAAPANAATLAPAATEPASPIERVRRADDDHRERFDPTRSPRSRGGRTASEPALPSVQDVLNASQWARRPTLPPPAKAKAAAVVVARPKPKAAPAPTTAVAPAQWSLPAWLTWPPATFLTLTIGAAFTICSWWWAVDSKNAATAGQTAVALRLGTTKDRPLASGVVPPSTSWWRSTPRHLAQWSNYLSVTKTDHGWAESPADLIEGAAAIAPLDPVVRLAKARMSPAPGQPANPAEGLGLSRDAVSLAWTARTLHKAGKHEAAVRAYRRALEIAGRTEPGRDEPLVFSEDPDAPRYLLPGEKLAGAIVGELIADLSWTYRDWSPAIPEGSVAALVAAKGLRAQGRSEADRALGDLVASIEPLDGGDADGRPESRRAVEHAVAAEALMMRSAWKDAQIQYRAAVVLMADDKIKRSWWFNLADVAAHLNDENQRRIALDNVLAAVDADEVSRRALDVQRGGPRGRLRSNGTKAN